LFDAFKNQHKKVAADMTKAQGKRAASSVAATRMVNKVLKLRKQYSGVLLKALRGISKLNIVNKVTSVRLYTLFIMSHSFMSL